MGEIESLISVFSVFSVAIYWVGIAPVRRSYGGLDLFSRGFADGIKIAGYVGCQANSPFGIDCGADMIVTPCPACQMNVEVYQDHINQKYKTNFNLYKP